MDGRSVIFPICAVNERGEWRLLGAGFFILKPNVFVTAKHVLYDDVRGCEVTDNLAAFHFVNEQDIRERRVRLIFNHPKADVAIGVLADWEEPEGFNLENRVLTLTKRIPEVGERVNTLAYPQTEIHTPPIRVTNGDSSDVVTVRVHEIFESESLEAVVQSLVLKASIHSGKIIGSFEEDYGDVKTVCYRATMELLPGTSGGPVFDVNGHVCAVNKAEWDLGGKREFALSSIRSVLEMKMPEVTTTNGRVFTNETVEKIIAATRNREG